MTELARALDPENIMRPFPFRILKITRETQAEFTFRAAFPYEVGFGQFCMLSIPKIGEAPISVSGTGDGYAEFTIRKVGRLTDGVFELREGGVLYIRGPFGKPWPVETVFSGAERSLVVITGGTGLAPVRSMLNHFRSHPESIKELYLLSGFADESRVLFSEERALWRETSNFRTIYALDRSVCEGFETGLVTEHIAKIPFSELGENYNVAIVGPPEMMRRSALECLRLGVPEDRLWVSFERKMQCAVGKCGHCKVDETYVCLEGPVFRYDEAKGLFSGK